MKKNFTPNQFELIRETVINEEFLKPCPILYIKIGDEA